MSEYVAATPSYSVVSKPRRGFPNLVSGPTFTNNSDGTGDITVTFATACYAGVDFGTVSATYTESAFDYSGAGPSLELATAHTIPVPDAMAGGTLAAGTYYFRLWIHSDPGGFTGYHPTAEFTGVISLGAGIGLEGSTDVLLQETGDVLFVESGPEVDISAMPAATAFDGTELMVVVQGGVTEKATLTQVKTFVNG